MAAVWMRVRAEIRSRRPALLALAVLASIAGGCATAAAAGANRTATAHDRLIARSNVTHVEIGTGGAEVPGPILDAVERSRFVRDSYRPGLFVAKGKTDGGRVISFPDFFVVSDPGGRAGVEIDKVRVVGGRFFDPGHPSEAVINRSMADRLNVRVGGTVELEITDGEDVFSGAEPRKKRTSITIVGIYVAPSQFDSLSGSSFNSTVFVSPAFFREHEAFAFPADTINVQLADAASASAFLNDLRVRGIAVDEPILSASIFRGIEDLNRFPVIGLWLLCGLIGIAGTGIAGQAIARHAWAGSDDDETARSLGMSRPDLILIGASRGALVGLGAAILTAVIAFLLSPLTPIGSARDAEPDPGFAFDEAAIAIGCATTFAIVLLSSTLISWRLAAKQAKVMQEPTRPSFAAGLLARGGMPPSAVAGARLALETGRGKRTVPVRTALLGTTIAVAALAMALGFAASLVNLVDSPELSGYTFDGIVIGEPDQLSSLRARVDADPQVARTWMGTLFTLVDIGGAQITAFASEEPPALIEGRAARAPNEVLLDGKTMRELRVRVGDRVDITDGQVEADAEPQRVTKTIVGRFSVPRLAWQGQRPDQGASMTLEGLRAIDPSAVYEGVHVRFNAGVDTEQANERLKGVIGPSGTLLGRRQPAQLRSLDRLSDVPIVLAGLLGVLALLTLAHALVTSIRLRRRDLAVLKSLGFVSRQLRATVSWQATLLTGLAVLLGSPIGIAAGRWSWNLFADRIGSVPQPVVPSLTIAVVAISVFLAANIIAAFPARAASRTQAAVVLRAE